MSSDSKVDDDDGRHPWCPGFFPPYKSKRWWALTISTALLPFGIALLTLVDPLTNSSSCKCIAHYPSDVTELRPLERGGRRVTVNNRNFSVPASYGIGQCKAWDAGLQPFCGGVASARPDWCQAEWCYVNEAQCDKKTVPDAYLIGLSISYAACGGGDGMGRGTSS